MRCNITFFMRSTWHHHHAMPMVSSLALLHLLSDNKQHEVQHWHHCWHHMGPKTSKMVQVHSLGQDNWNEVQHIFGHLMPLTSTYASHDAIGIHVGVLWCHCIGVSIMWCGLHHQWCYCITYVKMTKMMWNMTLLGLVTPLGSALAWY